jgi:hypothetical protein
VRKLVIAAALVATFLTGSALADYIYRDADNVRQVFFAFTCQVTKNCSAQVLIDSTGTEKATVGNPLRTAEANSAAMLAAVQSAIPAGSATIGAVFGSPNVTPADCSGTIAVGGTAQNAIAASAAIHGFTIANIDAAAGSGEPIWMSLTGTATAATAGSYPLPAPALTTFAGMSSYTTPLGFGVNHAISVLAATTGHKYSCTVW